MTPALALILARELSPGFERLAAVDAAGRLLAGDPLVPEAPGALVARDERGSLAGLLAPGASRALAAHDLRLALHALAPSDALPTF
jgi:hypothetical protein